MPNMTENYQLNQYLPQDDFLRTDFNEDNAKIDAALGDKSSVVVGTYTGDNAARQIIPLGFTPKAMLVCTFEGRMDSGFGGLAFPGHPAVLKEGNTALHPIVAIVDGGFEVYLKKVATSQYVTSNSTLFDYHYLALK